MVHQFPTFAIDEHKRELRAGPRRIELQPRVFDLLAYLARHHERVVPKDELLDAVWAGVTVADGSLQRAISLARRALADSGASGRIRTFPRQGYRLVADPPAPAAPAAPRAPARPAAPAAQRIQFVQAADGTALAYAVSGLGYPLVKAANWLSHLEYDHQSPVWRHWWSGLAERFELIRYDERGCGLSEWNVTDFTIDTWRADLETVIARTRHRRYALLGISQGAAVAIAHAVRHPDRVSHLVLYGGFLQGRMRRKRTLQESKEALMLLKLVRLGWGRGNPAFRRVFASLFMPEGTPAQHASFVELQQRSCSPENAEHFMRAFGAIDVVDLARQVSVPTLVLHARGDQEVPEDQARLMARTIPGAKLVLLDSRNHILGESEPAWPAFLEEVTTFLATP